MSLRILHYSDLETVLDDPTRCARLAGELNERRDERTLVVGSGDNTAPGALSLATDGEGIFEFFRAVDADGETFGNHDFDFGTERARQLANDSPQPWLCANAFETPAHEERFASEATEPSRMVEIGDTHVGIIGVGHPKTATINPAATGVEFTDPTAIVRNHAERLRTDGAEYVIVVSHCGHGDEKLAAETDVDAIFGGHIHDRYAEVIDGTAVTRPGRGGEFFSEVTLASEPEVKIHEVGDQRVDHELRAALAERLDEHGLREIVATVETPVERTETDATVAESRVGNIVVDALRWRAGTDVAISPPGAIRSGDPLSGEVTVAELIGLTPYRDELAVVSLSGERLREALVAVPFGYHDDGYPDRYCSHVSGATVRWDDRSGELIDGTVAGEPIEPQRSYTVAVADYLVDTDHVNGAFGPEDVIEKHGIAREAVVEYARECGLSPTLDGRIERPYLAESATDM